MTLRRRLTLLTAVAVAAAVVVVAGLAWWLARDRMRAEIDETLVAHAEQAVDAIDRGRTAALAGFGEFRPGTLGGRRELRATIAPFVADDTLFQVVTANGGAAAPRDQAVALPVDALDVELARSASGERRRDVTVEGLHLRLVTRAASGNRAVQVARSLEETDATLDRLAVLLTVMGVIGVAGAAAVGRIVAVRSLRPVGALTDAAEHVARTEDLGAAIEVTTDDELGRLGRAFNSMLASLRSSRSEQHRLVTDASHELRTPLTAIRTNAELLARRGDELDSEERAAIVGDLVAETTELSALAAELVDLATDARTTELVTEVDLVALVDRVVARARRRVADGVAVDVVSSAGAHTVEGRPASLERAVTNLVDNASKWTPAGGRVRVEITDTPSGAIEGGLGVRIAVHDSGPGIPVVDRPHVFERFWRSDAGRATPGSGLGLAIVAQAVDVGGGATFVDQSDLGGAVVGFDLPIRR